MNRSGRFAIPILGASMTAMLAGVLQAADGPTPRFVATLSKEETPGHAVAVDVDVAGCETLILVTTGPSFADWAEPRLMGPGGETKLTERKWRHASVGWDMVRVNANSWGRPLAIDGKEPAFGLFVHAPSMIVFDLPPGTTRFRARAGLDHGPSNNITFAVYVDNPLLDEGNAALWKPRRGPATPPAPSAYVEMVGGDRLPGEVVGYAGVRDYPSGLIRPHFLVRPALHPARLPAAQARPIRVLERFVRRVVWQSRPRSGYAPRTVFFLDGRELRFRSVRFDGASLKLLTKQGIVPAAIVEIAEIHLPQSDPWRSYFDEASVLSPDGRAPIVRFATADGAQLTASPPRCAVRGSRGPDNGMRWWSVVGPAWCMDPLDVADDTVLVRAAWPPHQVPLTRIGSSETRSGAAFSKNVPSWQAGRNTQIGPLESGGTHHRWGCAVHAPSELAFPLHADAVAVRMRVGLDRSAGDGGCARARIFVDSAEGTPRWESPLLIGSATTVDSGIVRLPRSETPPRLLILQADPVMTGHPDGADPMDIRDTLDWLEPAVELDGGRLQTELAARKKPSNAAWRDWTVVPDDRAYRLANYWDDTGASTSRFRLGTVAQGKPLTLAREIEVDRHARFLVVSVHRPESLAAVAGSIEVRVDGKPVAEHEVPIRNRSRPFPLPLVVPLAEYAGQTVKLELVQSAGDAHSVLYWEAIDVTQRIPMPLCLLEDDGKFDALDAAAPGSAVPVEDGPHSGTRAVRIEGPGRMRLALPEGVLRFRERPEWNEYRFLRFAFRKADRGRVCLELQHANGGQAPVRYDAGRGQPSYGDARRGWNLSLPDAWIVQTWDVFESFGEVDVTGLVLGSPDGGPVLLDHVYLARTRDDFDSLPAPSEGETNYRARTVLASPVREQAMPATVALDLGDGGWATGIIVDGRTGVVLTAGHILAGPKREFDVHLADGRQVKGRRLGIDRAADVGAVRLDGKGPWPNVEIDFAHRETYPGDRMYLAIAHAAEYQGGQEPAAHICRIRQVDGPARILAAGFGLDDRAAGGSLLDENAKVIGVHSQNHRWSGEGLYTPTEDFAANWPRVARGQSIGAWPVKIAPKIGVVVESTADGCRVKSVDPQSPAQEAGIGVDDYVVRIDRTEVTNLEQMHAYLAGKDPGQTVSVRLRRGEQQRDVTVRLMPHRTLRSE